MAKLAHFENCLPPGSFTDIFFVCEHGFFFLNFSTMQYVYCLLLCLWPLELLLCCGCCSLKCSVRSNTGCITGNSLHHSNRLTTLFLSTHENILSLIKNC